MANQAVETRSTASRKFGSKTSRLFPESLTGPLTAYFGRDVEAG
jgi:hypothetical protein